MMESYHSSSSATVEAQQPQPIEVVSHTSPGASNDGEEAVNQDNDNVMAVDEGEQPEDPPLVLRDPKDRIVYKLSVKLIDTYKHINKVYYEAKAKRLREQADTARGGVYNDGYDDQNYDYILKGEEILHDRYILKHRMGKGSFGQVVCAYDQVHKREVAIKIIKSRKPFLIQARTEIEILSKILEKDVHDERHVVRLLDQFIHRNHQCLVFEILSFNLYELLRNTRFRGVSLNLIRKFTIQLLRSLELLARPDVNIIHCDLKPENILLRHPKRSAIKLIDFGSSCYENKRTYTYIQSRFYRSPEILFGLPYSQKIDMWSLGCVVVEMHTGEPLFGGTNQVDQVCRIVDVLGMPPVEMIKASPEKNRSQFFERVLPGEEHTLPSTCDLNCKVYDPIDNVFFVLKRPNKDHPPPRKLQEIIGVYTGGPSGRRANEPGHAPVKYLEYLDFIEKLLVYEPEKRFSAAQLFNHPYVLSTGDDLPYQQAAPAPEVTGSLATNQDDSNAMKDPAAEQPSNPLDGSASHGSAKDIDRDRREIGSTGSHKIRSHSAPGGVSYTTRVYTEESNPES